MIVRIAVSVVVRIRIKWSAFERRVSDKVRAPVETDTQRCLVLLLEVGLVDGQSLGGLALLHASGGQIEVRSGIALARGDVALALLGFLVLLGVSCSGLSDGNRVWCSKLLQLFNVDQQLSGCNTIRVLL